MNEDPEKPPKTQPAPVWYIPAVIVVAVAAGVLSGRVLWGFAALLVLAGTPLGPHYWEALSPGQRRLNLATAGLGVLLFLIDLLLLM